MEVQGHNRKRIALLAALGALSLGIAACGGDDRARSAESCVESWNASANAGQQATLAGALAADISLEGDFRVGTWPKAERTVPTTNAFAERPSGRAVVEQDSCLVVVPPSRVGKMAFFEKGGEWRFVRDNTGSRFPADAEAAVEHAREADVDTLGKLKLK